MFENDTHRAEGAVKAARRRGLAVPDEIDHVASMWKVVVDASHMRPPSRPTLDDIPATPEELRELIEQRAHAHRIAKAHNAIGSDFLEPVARKYNALVRERVPGWIMALQPEFNGLIKQLRVQAKKLPDNLDVTWLNWDDPAVTTAWEKAEGVAFQLDQIVSDRQVIAKAGDLQGEGGNDNQLYAVAKLPEPTRQGVVDHVMRDHISPEIQRWREFKHQPVSRWLQLARSQHLTIELATPSEVRARAALRGKWIEAIAVRGVAPQPTERALRAVDQALRAA
ncbi:hypothetical protein HY68_12745 [Streptomyces sp. AcH 505]|uniref:hypothetical protein n=1 Tax=Streptomyces sp. AcH 505 TaxID=352211 RepID=UPI0005920E37|nr:hypothetical protein HY68_12745 [Streptomyces sp. AcH 505]